MCEHHELLQSMDKEIVSAVEKYETALDGSPDEFATLLKTCELEEKQLIAQWLTVLDKRKSLNENGALVGTLVNLLICKELDENEFYQRLYESLNKLCEHAGESKEEISLLVICDLKIPYIGVGFGSISDERYIELTHLVARQFDELIKIFDSKFPKKTQTSSAVLRVLDSIEDEKQRAVLFSLWNNLIATGGQARQLVE